MALLEALAAFAVVMIIFSTIVTSIVEVIHRVLGMRHRHLKRILRFLFDDIIWKRLGNKLDREPAEINDDDKARIRHGNVFVEAMTTNPMSRLAQGDKLPGQGHRAYAAKSIENLTLLSFAERLGRTDVGKAILSEGEDYIDELLIDFTRSFDRIGRAATEFVSSRARTLSILVGICLALAANIDAGRLITTLIEDPDLRIELIKQADETIDANQEATRDLEVLMRQIKDEKLEDGQVIKIKEAIKAINTRVDTLQSRGFPIGFEYFPYCPDAKQDSTCERIDGVKASDNQSFLIFDTSYTEIGAWVRWLVMCFIAGLLIGLGGPFWYQVFLKLSQLMQVARALGFGGKDKGAEQEQDDAKSVPEDSVKPKSVEDAFRTAARVYNHTPTSPGHSPP